VKKILFIIFMVLISILQGCSSIEAYKEQESKNQRIAETHVELGIGYYKQGKMDYALQNIQKAIDAKPDYASAHSAIALVYEQMQKFDEADDHFREAISLSPEDGGLYNNYGVFLCNQKRYKEADKYYLKAIATPQYPTPELAYENAGSCARQAQEYEKAENYLTEALKRNPKLPVSLINMAEVKFEKNNFLSSRAFLQRFEAVSPHNAATLWLGVRIERKLGNKNAESNYAKQLQTDFPKSEQFKLLLNSQGENQS